MITLAKLNQMTQEEFTSILGTIFEHNPQIAAQTWHKRPFQDIDHLYEAMVSRVHQMSETEQLQLICAHPDLGSKAKMAEASVQEQSGVGLDRLSSQEYDRFQQLNQAYKDKFGFPFIVAVKNHTQETILNAFESRLNNTESEEKQQSLKEINKIALFRLQKLVQ